MEKSEEKKYYELYQSAHRLWDAEKEMTKAKQKYYNCFTPDIPPKPTYHKTAEFDNFWVWLVVGGIIYVVVGIILMLIVWFLDFALRLTIADFCKNALIVGAIVFPFIVFFVSLFKEYLPQKKNDKREYFNSLDKWNKLVLKEKQRVEREIQQKPVLQEIYEKSEQIMQAYQESFNQQCDNCRLPAEYRDKKLIVWSYNYWRFEKKNNSSIVESIQKYIIHDKEEQEKEERIREEERRKEEKEEEAYWNHERQRIEQEEKEERLRMEEKEREQTRIRNIDWYGQETKPEFGEIIDGRVVMNADDRGNVTFFSDDDPWGDTAYRDGIGRWHDIDDDSEL